MPVAAEGGSYPVRQSGAQLLRGFVAVSLAVVLAAALQRALVAFGVLGIRNEPLGQARFSWIGLGVVPALFACGSIFLALGGVALWLGVLAPLSVGWH